MLSQCITRETFAHFQNRLLGASGDELASQYAFTFVRLLHRLKITESVGEPSSRKNDNLPTSGSNFIATGTFNMCQHSYESVSCLTRKTDLLSNARKRIGQFQLYNTLSGFPARYSERI